MTEEEWEKAVAALRNRLSDEFLAVLTEAATLLYEGDYVEVDSFVRECYNLAGKEWTPIQRPTWE